MPTVRKLPSANEDLFQIWSFIAAGNTDAADKWIDRLDVRLSLLATQPLMGKARDELAKDLRSFPFGRYVIFYLPESSGITVVRILHSARDIDTAMGLH
ncbi:type II toxin-antitoxin system RelE/ParE family toxin [Limnohabitans sp.]|uniref:type II toxin-antitoxin system RelE/ParE family toxin n=1 Tax=Limnohabitans sp. TaxID=1907725 RepID=UPI00333E7E35